MRTSNWKRRPQEREGRHLFNGAIYITQGVNAKLRPAEIIAIFQDIRRFVSENGGADYFQVYENESGDKLYFIDHGSPTNVPVTETRENENCCILMLSQEY